MLRTTTRSTLLSLSSFCAAAPIEVITTTFILVTLAYFQLLHAIKGSDFFQLPQALPSPKPVHLVRLSNPPQFDESRYALPSPPSSRLFNSLSHSDNWATLPISEFRRILEANALEGGYVFPAEAGGNSNGEKATVVLLKQLVLVKEDGDGMDEWMKWLLYETGPDIFGKRTTYQDVCFQCDVSIEPHPLHPAQSTVTLFFNAPTPDTHTLTYMNHLNRLPAFTSSSNTTFRTLSSSAGSSWGFLPSLDGAGLFAGLGDAGAGQNEREEEDLLSGLRNVRWFAYAGRAFVLRFYNLAKVSQNSIVRFCRISAHRSPLSKPVC
jgi:hydroxymethylglutaryl-CoA reductase (NADPH)